QGFRFEARCGAFFEVSLHDGPEGYDGLRSRLGLLKLRIVAEVHRGERALCPLACFVGVERLDSPERHAPLLRPDAILDDPRSLAAISQPQPETGQGSVKDDSIIHANGKRQPFDTRLGEPHGKPRPCLWEAYGKHPCDRLPTAF